MGRKSRRRKPQPRGDITRVLGPTRHTVTFAGQEWTVQPVRGNDSGRSFTCPGCQQQLSAGIGHIVAWPTHSIGGLGGVEDRRHWHEPCWQARDTRGTAGSFR